MSFKISCRILPNLAHILLYVDDIMLTASTTAFLHEIIAALHKEFSMTDLAPYTIY
jgi:hypothetical protein